MEMVLGKILIRGEHEVEWTIKNFSSYTVEGDYYYSPRFIISNKQWYIGIFPNGRTTINCTGWVSLYLHRVRDKEMEETALSAGVIYSFGVKKCDGTVEQFNSELTRVFLSEEGYGYHTFLQRSELLRRKSELLPSDVLTLTCSLRTAKEGPDGLSQDLVYLFTSKRGCDAVLRVQGEEFWVHKLILSTRSPVFAVMFEIDMKEKGTGLVDIPDCNPCVFREFLLYLYSGRIQNEPTDVIELYKIACKYCVEDLKLICLTFILAHVTVENFIDVFTFARQFGENEVKEKVQKIFNANFEKILKTNKWIMFMQEESFAANELLQGLAKEMKYF